VTERNGPVAQYARGKKTENSRVSPVEHAGTGGLLGLQRVAGNQAVSELLTHAAADAGRPLDPPLQQSLARSLGADLSRVRVHESAASAAAAEGLGARAYTIGSDIHLGREAAELDQSARNRLLAHEAVHTVQQGGRPVKLEGVIPVSNPGDASETQARAFAETLTHRPPSSSLSPSPALALRDSLRTTAVAPLIQRDIVGSRKFAAGEFSINFTKTDAAAAGDQATEDGVVTFMPSATAPESDSIKFIQIVRLFDVTTGKQKDWSGTTEANRNKMQTKRDFKKNIAPGFFVDHLAATQTPRTAKADPRVSAFYMDTPPVLARNKEGKRRGKTIEPAQLDDTPGSSGARKFNFVTVAKAADTGIVYGTVLWGFETFIDKGKAKIRGEYKSFRTFEGETFVEALKQFNEFYKNPGTPGAPTT
jgi:Domain of unknown function (DUF4157)